MAFIKELKKNKVMFLMLLPVIVYFIIFHYIPMGGVILAFKTYKIKFGMWGSPWAGLKNFRFLFISGTLGRITFNTIAYNLVFLIIQQGMAMVVAILITELRGKWYKKICQQLIFLPYFVSFVVLGAFVYNLFNFEYGLINGYLRDWGLEPLNFYNMPALWPFIIVFFNSWKWIGYSSVIYLATAAGIDPQLYEAAKIDGATVFDRIRHVTIPHFIPAFIVIFLLQMGRIMRGQFELFYNIVGNTSTLYNATDVVDTFVFRSLTESFDVGLGTAAGLYQSIICLVLVVTSNWIVKKLRAESALF